VKETDAAKIVAMLITAWPDSWRFLDEKQQAYQRKLYRDFVGDLDYAVADAAVRRLIGSSKRMPSVAEIRAQCMDLTNGRADRGGEAWGRILKLIGRYGVNRTPRIRSTLQADDVVADTFVVDDPVLFRVIDSMGWRELCLSENQAADRARVIELYEQLALQATQDRNVAAIAPPIPFKALPQRVEKAQTLGDTFKAMLPVDVKP
jgi:hypothetical protein